MSFIQGSNLQLPRGITFIATPVVGWDFGACGRTITPILRDQDVVEARVKSGDMPADT